MFDSVVCVMPIPRHGNNNVIQRITSTICGRRGLPMLGATGPLWNVAMEAAYEKAIGKYDWVLAVDSDVVFKIEHIRCLEETIKQTGADCVAALHPHRSEDAADYKNPLKAEGCTVKVEFAHFGLTYIRVKCLQQIARPWFRHREHFNDDYGFWQNWRDAGFDIHIDPSCLTEHMEETVRYFEDGDLKIKRLADCA